MSKKLEVKLHGRFEVSQGRFARAAQIMAAMESQLVSISMWMVRVYKMAYERKLALLRANLDEKAPAAFWAKGKGMTVEQVVAFVLEET